MRDIFVLLGFPVVTAEPLPTPATLLQGKLASHSTAIILCTPEYADAVSKSPGTKELIATFGKGKKDALHTLLCEGGFSDTASKVIDRSFLARGLQSTVKINVADPLVALLQFIDVFCVLSGAQGLGILPDLMDLELDEGYEARTVFHNIVTDLQTAELPFTIDFRLRISLLETHHTNPLTPLLVAESIPDVTQVVQDLVESTHLKTNLLLCPTSVDTALFGLALERELIRRDMRCVNIDCFDYQGNTSHLCVSEGLLKAGIKSHSESLAVRTSPVVLIFKGYHHLGTYDNLFVKNHLSSWPHVGVLVTCNADVFQHRSHASCFLPDPTAPNMESLKTTYLPSFASAAATREYSSRTTQTPKQQVSLNNSTSSAKRQAQQLELTNFLQTANALLVKLGGLNKDTSQNPRIFISYAWEQQKDVLAIQQKLLRQFVSDLQTLGFPTWLDVERMTGDIDQQMAGNIATSRFALVIGTPLYCERAEKETNVKKEYLAILDKSKDTARPLQPVPILFGEHGKLPLPFQKDALSLTSLSHFDAYANFLTEQLIPRILEHSPSLTHSIGEIDDMVHLLQKQLYMLPGKHLVVEHNQDMIQSHDIDNRLEGYIHTFGLDHISSPIETRYDLKDRLEQFLTSSRKTCIVFGGAGSGKSLFSLSTFANMLQSWHWYRKDIGLPLPEWLPIYIPLKNFSHCKSNEFVSEALATFELGEADIKALKEGLGLSQKVLFILDGFDELGHGSFPNLPQQLQDWNNAKVLITCRPEHFESESQHPPTFALHRDSALDFNSFETHHVSPFIQEEIQVYVTHHAKQSPTTSAEETFKVLQELPGLMALLSNPFLLNLTLQSLNQLQKNFLSGHLKDITRTAIYQAFSEYWFGKEAHKRNISDRDCKIFAQQLAFAMFTHKTIMVAPTDTPLWSQFFNESHSSVQNSCPLRRNNQEYTFLHKSLFEFFAAGHLWDSLFVEGGGSLAWNQRMATSERAIVDFLAELYHQSQNETACGVDQFLLALLFSSRSEPTASTAASNAVTVLNAARYCFSGMDLSKIRIPGADLEGALMHHTVLDGSYLKDVVLSNSFLFSASLKGCMMTGLKLEEPVWERDEQVECIAFSPGGKLIATVERMRGVFLWSADSHKLIKTMEESEDVERVTFLIDGNLISSYGDTIEMWDIESGDICELGSGLVSPNGLWIASVEDGSLKVQDTQRGTFNTLAVGQDYLVTACSPDGNSIATFIEEDGVGKVRVWDIRTGAHKTLQSENGKMEFSPDGSILAIGGNQSYNSKPTVWNLTSGIHQTLQVGKTWSLAFSPDGYWLATGHDSNTIVVWNLKTGEHQFLYGYLRSGINSLAFSPDSLRLFSAAFNQVQTWDVESWKHKTHQQGHAKYVTSVTFSPDGRSLASTGADGVVIVWNLDSGRPQKRLFHDSISSPGVAFFDGSFKGHSCNSVGPKNRRTSNCTWRLVLLRPHSIFSQWQYTCVWQSHERLCKAREPE